MKAQALIDSDRKTGPRIWRPITQEMRDYLDTIARHNATPGVKRIGCPRLRTALIDDFGLTLGQSTIQRYMADRTKELGL